MPRPVIALLTDFGTRDHYAGTMKGVIATICPDAHCIDITHDVDPHDVLGGALELSASYKFFPSGTVFLAVVDPGVGSSRRPIAATVGGFKFVAPDNGVLTLVFRESRPKQVVELTERKFARATVSRTFEGRDRFAPAAAWLAKGVDLSVLGKAVTTWTMVDVPEPAITASRIDAEILRVDRFGNLITNIDRGAFEEFAEPGGVTITVAGIAVETVVGTYADAPKGRACALFGSTEHLEIAMNGASAAQCLKLARGAPVTITRT